MFGLAEVQTVAPQTEPLGQGGLVPPLGAQHPHASQWGEEGDHDLQPGPPAPTQQLPQRHCAGPGNAGSLPARTSEGLGWRVCPHPLCPPLRSPFERHRGTDISAPFRELHCIQISLCGIKNNIRREGLPTTETQLMGLSKLWQTSVPPGFQTQSPWQP